MSVLVLPLGPITPTPPGTPQLASPTGFVVTPNSDGTINVLSANTVANADRYFVRKALDQNGIWVETFGPLATPGMSDNGLTAARHREYEIKASRADATYLDSNWVSSGDIYTAPPVTGSMPTVAKAVMSLIPNAPASGGMESEFGFTTTANQIILEVNSTSTGKVGTVAGFTARAPYTRYFTCTERDALEITDAIVTALGGNANTGIVVVYSVSTLANFGTDLTIVRAHMTVCYQTAPSPGYAHRRTNLRIAASDVWVWHPHYIQGNSGSTPSIENADGIQVGAASFYGTPIQRAGASHGTLPGATDESGELYSAGDKLFLWKCNAPFPLSNAGRSERHGCAWVASEILTQATFGYCNNGNGDFRIPLLTRAPICAVMGGFSINSASQWANANPNNRANGGFGANVAQLLLIQGHGFIKGPNSTSEELVQISEYIAAGPPTMVTGSSLCLKDNWTVGFSAAINDSNQLSYVREYNGGPFGSGTKTTGLNATYYVTTPQVSANLGGYVPATKPVTLAQKRDYVLLMSAVTGSRNADRGTWNYDKVFFEQAVNELDVQMGNAQTYPSSGRPARVDSLSQIPGAPASGYPTFATNTRNLKSGTHPIPDDPDTLYDCGSGRFITKLAKWAIEEHNAVVQLVEPSLIS